MKKLIYILLLIIMTTGLISCIQRKAGPSKKENQTKQTQDKDTEQKLNKKEGQKVIDDYMRALIIRDNKVNTFYSDNLKKQIGSFASMPEPHPNGYKISSIEEKEGKLEVKAKLMSIYTGQPYFSLDETKFTIIKEKGSYVIDKLEKDKNTEIVDKEKKLFMVEGGDIKGNEIIKIDQLPNYIVPQGGTLDQKYQVGKDNFGPIAGDSEGKKLAISTVGTYPSLVSLDLKEKTVKPIDIYFDIKIQSLSWSQDGNFLAVEIMNPNGLRSIYIYDTLKEKRVDDTLKVLTKSNKYSINNPYWISENELIFNVSGISGITQDEQKILGTYKFDAKNLSLTKF